jgi:hypothetical protein
LLLKINIKELIDMLNAIIAGAVIGFILGVLSGAGFQGALGGAFILAVFAVPVRKWIMRTFWM